MAVNRNYKERRLGTVGPIVRGYEWKFLNDRNEDVTESGEGVLWVKGPSVTSGYFRDPVMTDERFAAVGSTPGIMSAWMMAACGSWTG